MFTTPSRALMLCFTLLGFAPAGFGQTVEPIPGKVEIAGTSYPYVLVPPAKIVDGQSYPLVLFLHGAGERRDDNKTQGQFPMVLAEALSKQARPCFVLAPQCPQERSWVADPSKGQAGLADPMRAAMAALELVVRNHPVDRERISISGTSMGGVAAWDLASRFPAWFSAVVPVCGGGDPNTVARLAGLPTLVWHGGTDSLATIEMSKGMVEAMRALKLPVQITELPRGKPGAWMQAFSDVACLQGLATSKRNPGGMQAETARLLADSIDADERIAFLGDSITEAGNAPAGYVDQVRSRLAELSPKATILPAGISGHKVPDLLARYKEDVLEPRATMVFLYIGINDVWHSQGGTGTPIHEFEAGLRKLIQDFRTSGAEVVLTTPSTIGEKPQGENGLDKMLDEFAAVSRRVAAEEGATLCDLRQSFFDYLRIFNPEDQQSGILTSDGVHLNPAGNTFLAIEAARALREAALKRTARRAAEAPAEEEAQ
jgi:lysophospholipase L1-like esterase/predicted esterase